jgi:hypothetical protein
MSVDDPVNVASVERFRLVLTQYMKQTSNKGAIIRKADEDAGDAGDWAPPKIGLKRGGGVSGVCKLVNRLQLDVNQYKNRPRWKTGRGRRHKSS